MRLFLSAKHSSLIGRVVKVMPWVLLFLPIQVAALGVSVTPPQIELELTSGGSATAELTVANASDEPGLFTVSADEFGMGNHSGLPAQVEISPADFRLEELERQVVRLIVSSQTSGSYSTTLSVVGRPLAQGAFSAGSGIKVPFNFTVHGRQGRPHGAARTAAGLAWGLLSLLAFAGAAGVGWLAWKKGGA